jgi:hypothetical protein
MQAATLKKVPDRIDRGIDALPKDSKQGRAIVMPVSGKKLSQVRSK